MPCSKHVGGLVANSSKLEPRTQESDAEYMANNSRPNTRADSTTHEKTTADQNQDTEVPTELDTANKIKPEPRTKESDRIEYSYRKPTRSFRRDDTLGLADLALSTALPMPATGKHDSMLQRRGLCLRSFASA